MAFQSLGGQSVFMGRVDWKGVLRVHVEADEVRRAVKAARVQVRQV